MALVEVGEAESKGKDKYVKYCSIKYIEGWTRLRISILKSFPGKVLHQNKKILTGSCQTNVWMDETENKNTENIPPVVQN